MKVAMDNATLQTEARVGRALLALQEAHGVLGSGEWAAAAGVAAGDAGKLADELRALGVGVAGSAAEGWRLVGEADLALPELLEPLIGGTIFAGGVRHFARIGSTNAAAMRAGAEGWAQEVARDAARAEGPDRNAAQPTTQNAGRGEVWLAEEQTAGKGRAGHAWQSQPRDGIYLSALLRPRLAPSEVIILSLAAGLAVVEAVHEVTGLWGDLRWPNDVLLGGRKFCGILTELNAEVTRVRYVVVGMGLNVNHAQFPPELEPIATSLYREAGQRVSRVELVAALLRALDREQAALSSGAALTRSASTNPALTNNLARERILRRFERHSTYCCGAAVTVEEDGGYQGVTRGLDERGFLQVETARGMRTVLSGGVRKR
jgi:BirA family transcriptional regulator, biotin operon repressor / biotin---[acetyl-CoA-carboxylase] ligase